VISSWNSDSLGDTISKHNGNRTTVINLAALQTAVGRNSFSAALGDRSTEAESLHDRIWRWWSHNLAHSLTISLIPLQAVVVSSSALNNSLERGVAESESAALERHVLSAGENHLLVGDQESLTGSLLDTHTTARLEHAGGDVEGDLLLRERLNRLSRDGREAASIHLEQLHLRVNRNIRHLSHGGKILRVGNNGNKILSLRHL